MKRVSKPALSSATQTLFDQYAVVLGTEQDFRPASLRNYLSDLQQFLAWCEATRAEDTEAAEPFMATQLNTPLLTCYRSYLQHEQRLRPASINRALISIKKFTAWLVARGLVGRDVGAVVKLIPNKPSAPRHLQDAEEEALVAAVTTHGTLRDRTIIVLLLHTGLRAQELCTLRRADVTVAKRSGVLKIYGKRNKYREVPLNATARAALNEYLPSVQNGEVILFASYRTHEALTERALGYLITKYALLARLSDVSPQDLRHRFGYHMAALVPLHRLAQIMGHDSLDTTLLYVRGTARDVQQEVEKIAWV